MNKYDTSEKRIGGGAKKKFEYRNQLPDEIPNEIVPQKVVTFALNYSQGSTKDDNDNEIEENLQIRNNFANELQNSNKITKTSNPNANKIQSNQREETKESKPKGQQETITTLKSQLATNKVSEHYTLIDNAMKEINGDAERTEDYSEFPEYNEEHDDDHIDFNERDILPSLQVETIKGQNLDVIKERTVEIDVDDSKDNKQLLVKPSRNNNIRRSKDSLNDRASPNKEFATSEDHSEYNERDLDLEEQYNEMLDKGEININNEHNSDNDSINDVAMRFF